MEKKLKLTADALNCNQEKVFTYELAEGISFTAKTSLTMEETVDFIGFVYGSCIDNETGEYLPEGEDLALRRALIDFYTDIELPEDFEEAYSIIYNTDIVELIEKEINWTQYKAINLAIAKKINFAVTAMTEMSSMKLGELINNVKELVNTATNGISDSEMEALREKLGIPDVAEIAKSSIFGENTEEVSREKKIKMKDGKK